MKTKIAGIGVAVVIFYAAVHFALGPLKLRGDAVSSVGPLLGMLLAVSLILERSTEVILSAFRSGSADLQDLEISEVTEKIEKAEAAGQPVTDLREELKVLTERRTRYRIDSRGIALWIGLGIGLAISAVGIRALTTLIDPQSMTALKSASVTQYDAFSFVDIAITGSVLAGGSEAINKLMKVYTSYTQAVAEKAKTK